MRATTKRNLKRKCPRRLWKAAVAVYRKLVRIKYRTAMLTSSAELPCFCPCCGFRFKSFVEGDYAHLPDFYEPSLFVNVKQDVVCPVCGSLPRHRILACWCKDNIDMIRERKTLYFAPERGMVIWLRANRIDYTTADLFDEDADLRIDIQATDLDDGSYDMVICNHVLEHVDDFRTALNEIRRILRPDGILICSFPVNDMIDELIEDPAVNSDSERLRLYGQVDHKRLFGRNADRFMTDAGFEVSIIDGKDCPDETAPVTAPGKYDINRLYVCRVKAGV